MKGRQINPSFFKNQGDTSAFNNVQQNRNNIKIKFKNARKQGTLNLSSCQPPLTEIPREVLALDAFLEEDEKFWEVEPLRIVDFSFNALTSLPDEIGNLTDCHTMKLRNNQLTLLPEALFLGCKLLRVLDCGSNMLTGLPDSIQDSIDLRELYLNSNRIDTLPEAIYALRGLQRLDVQSNQLTCFGPRYSSLQFRHLLTLNLAHNRLTSLPSDLSSLQMLESIECQDNQLSDFPSLLGLKNLKSVDVSQNRLRTFPTLPNPSVVSRCVLSYNAISSIPLDVCQSQMLLSELLLHNNALAVLPAEMEYLKALKVLDISNNNLGDLPPALGYIATLQILKTEGNPIRTIRQTILVKNAQDIKAYLRTRGPSIVAPTSDDFAPSIGVTSAGGGAMSNGLSLSQDEVIHRIRSMTTSALDLSGLNLTSLDHRIVLEQVRVMVDNLLSTQSLALLDLQNNLLTAFPLEIMQILPVRKCSLRQNALSKGALARVNSGLSLSEMDRHFASWFSLRGCTQLVAVDLSHNGLTHHMLEVLLHFCQHLTEIVVHHNPLQQLPPSIAHCTALQTFDASFCQLSDIRSLDFGGLSQLRTLDLSNNRIASLSIEVNAVHLAQQLTCLNMENNDLRDLPLVLGKLNRLQTLLIQGNPQKVIRPFVVQQGSNAVLQTLRAKAAEYQPPADARTEEAVSTSSKEAIMPSAPRRGSHGMGQPDSIGYSAPPQPYDSRSTAYSYAGMKASREADDRAARDRMAVAPQPKSLAETLAARGQVANDGRSAQSATGTADLRARRAEALARANMKRTANTSSGPLW